MMLVDFDVDTGESLVEVWVRDGSSKSILDSFPLDLDLAAVEHERLRWYFEEFPVTRTTAAERIAYEYEEEIRRIGEQLYRGIVGHPACRVVADAIDRAPQTVSISLTARDALAESVPWELMRRPGHSGPLVLSVANFFRGIDAKPVEDHPSRLNPRRGDVTRILMVVARPHGRHDLPFRSVARSLVQALDPRQGKFELSLLRPPSFERFCAVLVDAARQGVPYEIVHFDGHGEIDAQSGRGMLHFENEVRSKPSVRVSAANLRDVLSDGAVDLLVMNACRSAAVATRDRAGRVAAFHSLAHDIAASGTPYVVAMRYSTYVPAAVLFSYGFYSALAARHSVEESMHVGRAMLATTTEQPSSEPTARSAWAIPTGYADRRRLQASLSRERLASDSWTKGPSAERPSVVPAHVGHDGVIFELDRALFDPGIVLLHGLAGCGKSNLAREFARWLAQTSAVEVRVVESMLGGLLPADDTWTTIEEADRPSSSEASTAATRIRGVWLVEIPIPTGNERAWTDDWSSAVVHAIDAEFAIVLLSRQSDGLSLPVHVEPIHVTNLSREESVELLDTSGGHLGRDAWGPLVEFAKGNPFTLLLMRQRAEDLEARSSMDYQRVVEAVRATASRQEQEEVLGPQVIRAARALFGPPSPWDELERSILGALCLYEGVVMPLEVAALWVEGGPPGRPTPTGEDVEQVLLRTVSRGLATQIEPRVFALHPLTPIAYRDYFDELCEAWSDRAGDAAVLGAFVKAEASIGNFYFEQSERVGRPVKWEILQHNLLAAAKIAGHLACWTELALLVRTLRQAMRTVSAGEQVRPVLDSYGSLLIASAGGWNDDKGLVVLDMMAADAERDGDYDEWMGLSELGLKMRRARAHEIVERSATEWTDDDRVLVRSLAVSLHGLGRARSLGSPPTLEHELDEAIEYAQRLDDWRLEANVRLDKATYEAAQGPGRFQVAVTELGKAIAAVSGRDSALMGLLKSELGKVEIERARRANNSTARESFLDAAEKALDIAKQLIPKADLRVAVVSSQFGQLYAERGDIEGARRSLEDSIRIRQQHGDWLGSADACLGLAVILEGAGWASEAEIYAESAVSIASSIPAGRLIAAAARELQERLRLR